jgi:murein DD-endopeptidase MepM/ murein hydrolase activator NlpD
MSFDELFAESEAPPPAQAESSAESPDDSQRRPRAKGESAGLARESLQLRAALLSFATRARAVRSRVKRGSPMPPTQMDNWTAMNATVDDFLARPARETAPLDVVRARVTLEAELEEDARIYGDIPADLADAVLVRVHRLSKRMALVRKLKVKPAPIRLRFSWPVEPVVVTSTYGSRLHPITGQEREHLGVDLATRHGQLISAAADGVVRSAGWNGSHGLQVELQHEGELVTRYSHLSRVLVEPGDVLAQGDVVGLAGKTGLATGVHLHFELWRKGEPCDPMEELGPVDAEPGEEPPLARLGVTASSSAPWPAGSRSSSRP